MSSSALNLDFNLFFSSPFSPFPPILQSSSEKSSNGTFVKSGGFPMISWVD
jgi:hypothetical protein